MQVRRIKITYAEQAPTADIDLAAESGFGGFGTVHRGEDPRVLYLSRFRAPYDLITAQLTACQSTGMLKWEES